MSKEKKSLAELIAEFAKRKGISAAEAVKLVQQQADRK